jgi:hypothetical protein
LFSFFHIKKLNDRILFFFTLYLCCQFNGLAYS